MKRIYAAFLRLYPREYRNLFGPEVLNVFTEAAQEQRARGLIVWVCFLIRELSGALVSAAGHWVDRLFSPSRTREPQVAGAARSRLFGVAGEAEKRVNLNLKKMTDAIARHDFIAARACSFEERKAREELRKLRDRYGFNDDETILR